jgi:hypothetical protein
LVGNQADRINRRNFLPTMNLGPKARQFAQPRLKAWVRLLKKSEGLKARQIVHGIEKGVNSARLATSTDGLTALIFYWARVTQAFSLG